MAFSTEKVIRFSEGKQNVASGECTSHYISTHKSLNTADMNGFFILLICFFARTRCETVFQNGRDTEMSPKRQQSLTDTVGALASVREYPSLLHKCTATFLSFDTLLTTARCLYCEGCQLFVHALSDRLTDGVSYNISKIVIHPNYERVPHMNDFGLIKLEENVTQSVIFRLPSRIYDDPGLNVVIYRWKFTPNYREYRLERVTEKTISNAMCSLILNQYIDYKIICTRRSESVSLGLFDQGTPLIDNGVILGIYEVERVFRKSKVETYHSVFPYVDWIQEVMRCNFNCNPTFSRYGTTALPAYLPESGPTTTQRTSSTNPLPKTSPNNPSSERDYNAFPASEDEVDRRPEAVVKTIDAAGDDIADPTNRQNEHAMEY